MAKKPDPVLAALTLYEQKNAFLRRLINPLPDPAYATDAHFMNLEGMLESYRRDWGLNLAPDFQRGHVWTKAQRVAYVEGILRGTVGESQRIIQFNAPHWEDTDYAGELPREIQIVDGLQRLTTVRQYLAGELKIFGGLTVGDFDGSSYSARMGIYRFRVNIHTFATRQALLRYYLEINSGGTPHSKAEIKRVQALLAAATETRSNP